MQLIHAIPLIWIQKINDNKKKKIETNYVVQDHHLIRNTRMIVLEKYIQCYCDHQAVYILSKNILTIFFQMKILIGKKKIIYY